MLSNVSDIYGNYIMSPVTWSFGVADFGAKNASVYVAGARLSTSHTAFRALEGETFTIEQDLSVYLLI